jgi:uncharacterized iron-regulated protein
LLAFACGGTAKSVTAPTFLQVEDAELPYRILRADGRELSHDEFYSELSASRAVCVGESHDDSHHHWAQLEVLEHVSSKSSALATGMEMFQRPFQGVLDDFAAGRIGEKELLRRSDWEHRWTYDWRFYAPMVRLTVKRGGALLALNISKELKDKWKASDTVPLTEADRAKIPELNLEDQEHRQWFRSLMESLSEGHAGHGNHALEGDPEAGGGAPAPAHPAPEEAPTDEPAPEEVETDFIDTIYPVQVLWDETMADTASRWVLAAEGRQVVIIAGNGHCHESAIVRRMKRRGVEGVVSVRPVVDLGGSEVADLLASPQNDYLFVMEGKK